MGLLVPQLWGDSAVGEQLLFLELSQSPGQRVVLVGWQGGTWGAQCWTGTLTFLRWQPWDIALIAVLKVHLTACACRA